jgi:hypothetical protein
LPCRNCGGPVDPRRVELGYDYCLKEACQQQCLRRVELAAVGVNKAADYYMKAEEVVPPRPPAALSAVVGSSTGTSPVDLGPVDPGPGNLGAAPARKQAQPKRASNRPKTALDRLREQEHVLDEALGRSYERFRLGEITAAEMHRERDELVGAFNRKVMAENIRYRSLLRRVTTGSR